MKGVIVAAGYGTRFLPVTKTVPKEMLPLVTRPSIEFIVEELVASGITEILFITSRRKKAIEDYFDREVELESVFQAAGERKKLAAISPPKASFFFVHQPEMRGTGHALLLARPFTGNEPFVVAYPDDLHFGEKPLSLQLVEMWKKTGCTVLATLHDPPDINRYGIISIAPDGLHVTDIVEKPPRGKEPSREASIGRFLYTPDFLDQLEKEWKSHGEGEFFHTPAVRALAQRNRVVFSPIEGERLDTGEPGGYLEAIIRYADSEPSLKKELERILDVRARERSPR
ncbi:MAG TPA: UTP--glucose-1-phosphate uridylyltransferase [Spirochaetia bacterium]|nr:UTP--glucose-1-phosphate uridylyltransferase [Spirochaetia bacterium]